MRRNGTHLSHRGTSNLNWLNLSAETGRIADAASVRYRTTTTARRCVSCFGQLRQRPSNGKQRYLDLWAKS